MNKTLFYFSKLTGLDEIPGIEKPNDDVKNQPLNNNKMSNVNEADEDTYLEYNIESATTTWNIGLVVNIVLNGLLWFCVVLSM